MKGGYRLVIGCLIVLGIITEFGLLQFGRATARAAQAASPALALTTIDASSTTSEPAAAIAAPFGYLLYRNQQYHFSVYYPPNLAVHTYNEAGGAFTVALQDPTTNEGFEVYVTPYSGTQITQARFKLDEPSGVMDDPTNIVIDGVQATMFYGYNPIMGDTCKVWFIKGGLLYEVATFKALDPWLAQIMQTWQFI